MSPSVRLLKWAVRRPRLALGLALGGPAAALAAGAAVATRSARDAMPAAVATRPARGATPHDAVTRPARDATPAAVAPADGERNPRQLIGRVWLDRYPQGPRDEVGLLLFFGSGYGVYEHGSRYRATTEFFEFERQGDSVEITFLHDKARHRTRFAVKSCRDDDDFDLCLDFESTPRGPARYRSWGDDDEDEARVPWLAAWKRGAEARARR